MDKVQVQSRGLWPAGAGDEDGGGPNEYLFVYRADGMREVHVQSGNSPGEYSVHLLPVL